MLSRIKRAAPYLAALALLALFFVGPSFKGPHAPAQQPGTKHSDKKQTNYNIFSIWWDWTTRDSISFYTSLLAVFTGALVFVSVIQIRYLIKADRLARRALIASRQSAIAAKKAADAAKLNAEAVMSAEGAHLFPVIKSDNMKEILKIIRADPKTEGLAPSVDYCFKNYGKTPAILFSVMHRIEFFDSPSKLRTMHMEDDLPIEVIAGEKESRGFTVELRRKFTVEAANAVFEYRSELLFFGEAAFKDFFGRQFRCIWEFDGRGGGFSLIRHEERPDPDQKS